MGVYVEFNEINMSDATFTCPICGFENDLEITNFQGLLCCSCHDFLNGLMSDIIEMEFEAYKTCELIVEETWHLNQIYGIEQNINMFRAWLIHLSEVGK